MRHLWPGAAAALAAAALFGASTPFAKLLLGAADPWLLAGLLYLGAGLGLLGVEAGRRLAGVPNPEAPLRRSDWPLLAAVVAAGGIAAPVLLMFGLARIGAASASLLLTLEGLATMAIAWIAFRENVDRRILAGAISILAGVAVLSWPGQGVSFGIGALLVAAACLAWGIDNNLTRMLSASDPLQIAMVKGLAAGAVNLALALAMGEAWPPVGPVAGGLAAGFLGYGASLALYVLALRHLGAARTAAYFGFAPFAGAVLAVAVLGEPVTGGLILGGALIAAGIWFHLAERHRHAHVHEPMAHEHRHVHDVHHRHPHKPGDPPGEPHSHWHVHPKLVHRHPHYPDLHHRHGHEHG
jgi:drug/metabolite transporter (DMT)-like permease